MTQSNILTFHWNAFDILEIWCKTVLTHLICFIIVLTDGVKKKNGEKNNLEQVWTNNNLTLWAYPLFVCLWNSKQICFNLIPAGKVVLGLD